MRSWWQGFLLVMAGIVLGACGYKFLDRDWVERLQRADTSPVVEASQPVQGPPVPAPVAAKTEDKGTWRDANRERAAGNYVLDSHIPWVRERLALRDRKVIDEIMAQRGPVYEKMFADYGMTPQQIAQALHHIALIYQSKLDSRKAMTAQMNAQMDFEIRMQQVLGGRYHEYLAFESLGRAREESLFINQFAQSSGLSPIPGERAEALNVLLHGTGAYSQKVLGSLSGPRDEVARPSYGDDALASTEERQAVLSLGSAAVIEGARQQGFSPDEIATLQAYFEKEIAAYDQEIRQASNAIEGQIAVLERQLAKLKREDANAARSYEIALANLRAKRKSVP